MTLINQQFVCHVMFYLPLIRKPLFFQSWPMAWETPQYILTISINEHVFTTSGALCPRSFKNTLLRAQNMVALSLHSRYLLNRLTALRNKRERCVPLTEESICSGLSEEKEKVEDCQEKPTICFSRSE